MSTLKALTGTYTLDPSHTEIGFTARHAMVTKVRGAFNEFEGTASTGADLADAKLDVTIQAGSVTTGNSDRDGHLRSGDFFNVEAYPTIRFASTDVTAADDDTLRVEGDLTIKDATRPVSIDFEYLGTALDPFGNERVGLSGDVVVNRKDFGLEWNAALETGGVLVSENVTLVFEVSAIKAAEAATESDAEVAPASEAAVEAAEKAASEELAADSAATEAPAKAGIASWFKKLFATSSK